MKNVLLSVICIIISLSIYGRDIVAVANGDWTDPDTWGGFEPGPGDNIIIPAGITVEVSTNEVYEGDPMFITIHGTLEFVKGGAKLSLPCNSEVELTEEGHIVPSGAGSGSSRQLIICTEVVWEARDGELGGPLILKQSTLPVELVSFTGYVEDNVVKLEWSTASEINNDYFQLEKSRDGINYETLSIINGNGTVNNMSYYSALDDVPEQGTTYYRLKQVDFDGKFAYSDMVSVNFRGSLLDECKFKIFPNPCIGVCNVKLEDCNSADSDEITFYVYDAFGNTVLASSPKTISQGEAMFSFDSNNKLSPGMYIVRGNASEKKIEDRMIINK